MNPIMLPSGAQRGELTRTLPVTKGWDSFDRTLKTYSSLQAVPDSSVALLCESTEYATRSPEEFTATAETRLVFSRSSGERGESCAWAKPPNVKRQKQKRPGTMALNSRGIMFILPDNKLKTQGLRLLFET
jgi:hypothetical protein